MDDVSKLVEIVGSADFDCVLGIVRGGYIPAEAISRKYKKDFCIMRVKIYEGRTQTEPVIIGTIGDPHGRVLVVDDLIDSGETIRFVKNYLKNKGLEVITAVIWNKEDNARDVQADYCVKNVNKEDWIIQPMELFEK